MKWILSIYLVLIFILPVYLYAQEFNAGFVQGLWYSTKTIFADKPTRIYVAIRNNTGSDLTGTVEFFDEDTRIERKNVSALNGRIIESWADWVPSYGEHTLTATLSRTELNQVGSSTKSVTVTSALAEEIIFVDYDTDDDGIGNIEDIDDDGDGISDTVEETNGTDPLVFNEPQVIDIKTEESKAIDTSEDKQAERAGENTSTDNDTSSEGFERYFSNGVTQNTLSGLTQVIQNTKKNLDDYRERRTQALKKKNKSITEEVDVNEDGFGEITRTQEENKPQIQKPELKEDGLFSTVFSIAGNVLSAVYTGILSVLSFLLGNPALVQFLLLILILLTLYKTAQRMSRRPQ